ncbi:MAG: hypothetical protein JST80_11090 [Bdellovibrionales bacterium]|nr:hypothetical protein [Bdellovibrionales bacterium]
MKKLFAAFLSTLILFIQISVVHAAKPTKIMIIWASIGRGHWAAMKAVEDEIKRINPDAEIVEYDVREKMNPITNFIGKLNYEISTKFNPEGYDKWFKWYVDKGEKIGSLGDMPLVNENKPLRMLEFIKKEQPQVVISTFMHATEALIHLRDNGELKNVALGQIMTDFVNAYYFQRLGERLEMSFVPHETIRNAWLARGFPTDRVTTIGMPVKAATLDKLDNDSRLAFLKANNLRADVPLVVLVSGSAGVGNFGDVVKSIADSFKSQPVQIVAVTGKSTMNYTRLSLLKLRLPKNVDLRIHKLMPNADLLNYMKASTVVVTKSGGGSISEVAAVGKPMVLMDINGGQEDFNSSFFPSENMALSVKKEALVGAQVKVIADSEELQQRMLANQAKYVKMLNPTAAAEWALRASKERTDRAYGNKGILVYDDQDSGDIRWDMIENENKEIASIYYMIDGKKIGPTAIAAYWYKAKLGVKVRLVMDGWAPSKWLDGNLDPAMLKAAIDDGVEIRIYNPVDRSKWKTWLKLLTYKRTHDKMALFRELNVIDLSDRNMQNANFSLQKWGQPYRSIEELVQGPIVEDGWGYYEQVWGDPKTVPLDLSHITAEQAAAGRVRLQKYLDVMINAAKTGKHVRQNWIAKMEPIGEVHFFHDSVAYKGKVTGTEQTIVDLIDSAEVNGEIIIVSPYITLTPKTKAALLRAIRDRHVRLIVYTAAPHATDVKDSSLVFERQAGELMKYGAVIWQHQGPQLMHAKMIIVDGKRVSPMTHNVDAISEYINLESGLDMSPTKEIDNAALLAQAEKFVAKVRSESKIFETPTKVGFVQGAKLCLQIYTAQVWPNLPQKWR